MNRINRFYAIIAVFVILIITPSFTEQVLPTKLRVFVRNNLGNLEEGVSVSLFLTEEDYNNETNQVGETQVTDSKGRATFKELEPNTYYILARKGDLNNYGGGIMTGELKEGRMNKTTVVIN
jgi:uncharacterized protein (DUF2141 family)